MKKTTLISLVICAVLASHCHKKPSLTIPSCILEKIELIKNQPKWHPPAKVEEYMFEGKRVFLFSSPCCDRYNELFDENCNYLCAPSGGYTGRGDEKCGNFRSNAQLVKIIWEDDR